MSVMRELKELVERRWLDRTLRQGLDPAWQKVRRLASVCRRTGAIQNFIAALLLSLVIMNVTSASAAEVFFSPDPNTTDGAGSAELALPLSKLGAITLPRGRILLHGDTAQVTVVPEWQFDPHTVLSGRILDTRIAPAADGRTKDLVGVMFFDKGEWINYYDDPIALESVINADGSVVSGRITGLSLLDMDVKQVNGQVTAVPLSAIKEVRSALAFAFRIPLSAVPAAALKGTSVTPSVLYAYRISITELGHTFRLPQLKATAAALANDGDISTPKLVAMGTFLSISNLAQLAPLLAIPLGSQSTLARRAFFKSYYFNSTSINGPPGAASSGSAAAAAAAAH